MFFLCAQACIKGKQPRAALQVFEQLTRSGGVGVRSDEVIATLVVQAHAMLGEFDEAFQAITVRPHGYSTCF